MLKFVYYRFELFINKKILLLPIGLFFLICAGMISIRARVDLFISSVITIIEILVMGGGTVKFPKQVFF